MNVTISREVPPEFEGKVGHTYETQYVYTGFSRYNTETRMLSKITETREGRLLYHETPCDDNVFSRGYHTEHVRVTVYSVTPRVWKEELNPFDIYFFQQQED